MGSCYIILVDSDATESRRFRFDPQNNASLKSEKQHERKNDHRLALYVRPDQKRPRLLPGLGHFSVHHVQTRLRMNKGTEEP